MNVPFDLGLGLTMLQSHEYWDENYLPNMVYVFGAMLTDVIIFDSANLEIKQVMKTDGKAKSLVKMLSRGKAGKSAPLLLQEEDYFYT